MNVSSACVDNFHYYNQLELLLLILVCIHMSCFVYFGKKCSADRSWKFISVGPGKSWKMIFLKEWSPCIWHLYYSYDLLLLFLLSIMSVLLVLFVAILIVSGQNLMCKHHV